MFIIKLESILTDCTVSRSVGLYNLNCEKQPKIRYLDKQTLIMSKKYYSPRKVP